MHFIIAQSLGVPTLIHFLNENLISNPKVVMGMNLSQIPTQGPLINFLVLEPSIIFLKIRSISPSFNCFIFYKHLLGRIFTQSRLI